MADCKKCCRVTQKQMHSKQITIASWVNGLLNLFSDLEIINNSRFINVLKYKII